MIRCKSCNADVPPAWVHCITKGECPGCGSELFSKEEKQLLDELTSAMERMPNDPQGLAGWLLSNYKLIKLGEYIEPTEEFHRKKKRQKRKLNDDDEDVGLVIADNSVQKFLKRTGQAAKLAENNAKLAKLAKHLKKEGKTAVDEQYGNFEVTEEDEYDDVDSEEYEDEYVPATPMAKKLLANNVLMNTGENEQPLAPEEVARMMQKVAESGNTLNTGSQALQMQRMERLARTQGVADGSGQGSFRRGG